MRLPSEAMDRATSAQADQTERTILFDPLVTPRLRLSSHMVMAPMTRSRAVDANTANALMAQYYGQRASAGLIITEGTAPSPNGLGYARIPGLFSKAHVSGWKLVTAAVHNRGGKIFVQLMHTGRVAHVANLPAGAEVIGPGSAVCPGEMYTDTLGMQPHSVPRAMNEKDIKEVVNEHVQSARFALEAGFDGVELHGANGYLIEQYLNPRINERTDTYGQSIAGRNRLALEIAGAVVAAIGSERVGIRLSPYGVANGTGGFAEVEAQYGALATKLSALRLLYLHLVDHSSMGAPPVPANFKLQLRGEFAGLFILSGGFDRARAQSALIEERGDLVAFGRSFLANPDLARRLQQGAALNEPDPTTFYTPGQKGYTDYPSLTGPI
jgi:N-ethylmaleimide reductase